MRHTKNIKAFSENISASYLFLIIILILSSCKKFVEIEPPISSLITANVFDKNSTATAAQLVIYAQMQAYPQRIDLATGLSSDEFRNYSSSLTTTDIYANTLNASTDGAGIALWSQAFNFIYESNAILENLNKSPNITDAVKKQLTGESKFLRAYFSFYLVNLYGDIPLVLSTDYKNNLLLTRTPKALVYQQIINDLTDAQNLLNNSYVDATDTITTTERIRPTSWAATALLARVYLYTGDWVKAEAQSSSLINNASVFRLVGLDSVFLKNSKEAIWQLQPNSNNKYTSEGSFFTLTSDPTTSGGSIPVISDQLRNAFDSGDMRKTNWIGTFTGATNTSYYAKKYKATVSSTALTEYSMVLRLGEQYLIRAEARAQQNNISGAISDVNRLRARARATPTSTVPNPLPDLSPSLSQSQVLAAIDHERQVELFTEGDRWINLKRTNRIDGVMGVVTPQKGGVAWNSYQQLYPIPVTDIQNSGGKLVQNSGY